MSLSKPNSKRAENHYFPSRSPRIDYWEIRYTEDKELGKRTYENVELRGQEGNIGRLFLTITINYKTGKKPHCLVNEVKESIPKGLEARLKKLPPYLKRVINYKATVRTKNHM